MDPESWQRVREQFLRLVELPPDERAARLEHECAGEPEIRAELERLLASDGETRAWLRPPAPFEPASGTPLASLSPGTRLGPYVLRELLATGGMGAVWLAEQSRPRRLVALKTLRAELSDADAQKRLRAEAELLGHLRHPGIAQVFDAGTIELDGREVPYLAMEYVEGGRHLIEAARADRLGRSDRMRLFVEVCEAVHHGHQRGVLHRDLKPGNVLVDAEGRPKVIDFGLARALDPALLDLSLAETRAGEIFGTLSYMSPEHVSGRPYEVDVRSDVYALGCILCELLTDRPPLELDGLALPEIARRIAQVEPRLPRSIPTDLRWILVRTLEKDPARRYASASELAADVRRALASEPVLAGPPSSLYRARRFVRRNRVPVFAGVAVLAALLGGLFQARREARAAELARTEAQERGRQAEHQAELARTAGSFLSELFQRAAVVEGGPDARIADAIRVAERRLETIEDPTARAILGAIVGKAFLYLEDRERAAPLLESSIATLRAALPPDDLFRLDAEVVYADFLEQDQHLADSIALSEELLPRLETKLGPAHSLTCYLRFNLALARQRAGDPAAAVALFRRNLEVLDPSRTSDASTQRLLLRDRIGSALIDAGRAKEAVEELGNALELAAEQKPDDPRVEAMIHMDLGSAWMHTGEYELALDELKQAEQLFAARPWSLANRFALELNLASCLSKLDRLDEAEASAAAARRTLAAGWTAPNVRQATLELLQSQISLARGDLERAERSARSALALARELLAPDAAQIPFAQVEVARVLLARGDARGAVEEARAACAALAQRSDVDEAAVATSLSVEVEALLDAGELDEARERARELLARTPPDSPRLADREALLRRASGGD